MGNFEKLAVLVIVVIIVMILVVALYTWTDKPEDGQSGGELANQGASVDVVPPPGPASNAGGDAERWTIRDWEDQEDREKGKIDPSSKPPGESEEEGESGEEPEDIRKGATPTPPAEPPVKEEGGTWTYIVKEGDTISQICERELGTWRRQKEVMELNPGLDPLTIKPGDKLTMPPRGRASSVRELPGASKPAAGGTTPAVTTRSPVKKGDWYVVRRGDRLETIAKRAYGSIDRWPELWARNLQIVKDPDRLEEGLRIYIPK